MADNANEEVIPGLQLDPSLEAKLDGLDDQLKPLEGRPDPFEKKEEDEPSKEGSTEEEPTDTSADADTVTDDGYTIDEDKEEEVEEDIKSDDALPLQDLNPEQKYILDNISPVTVRGTIGSDTSVKEYKVYDPSQLPQGFKYADDREGASANKQFSMLENKAEQLQNKYRSQETQKSATEFKKREDTADREDIGELQRAGDIPKFKVDANSKDFDKDPAAVQIQEVLDYKEELNKKYYDEYQAGRPYKHIGFNEAFRMFKRENPVDESQQKEDEERQQIARRTSKTTGTDQQTRPKVRLASSRDLDNYIDSLQF